MLGPVTDWVSTLGLILFAQLAYETKMPSLWSSSSLSFPFLPFPFPLGNHRSESIILYSCIVPLFHVSVRTVSFHHEIILMV